MYFHEIEMYYFVSLLIQCNPYILHTIIISTIKSVEITSVFQNKLLSERQKYYIIIQLLLTKQKKVAPQNIDFSLWKNHEALWKDTNTSKTSFLLCVISWIISLTSDFQLIPTWGTVWFRMSCMCHRQVSKVSIKKK